MTALETFDYEKSNVNRLLQAMRHQEPDRIPHLEFWVTSQTVFEELARRSWTTALSMLRLAASRSRPIPRRVRRTPGHGRRSVQLQLAPQ